VEVKKRRIRKERSEKRKSRIRGERENETLKWELG
jgi:hypothetical protein